MTDVVQETHCALRNSLLKNVSRTFGSTMYAIPLFLLRLLFDVTVQVLWTNSLSANQCILQATPVRKWAIRDDTLLLWVLLSLLHYWGDDDKDNSWWSCLPRRDVDIPLVSLKSWEKDQTAPLTKLKNQHFWKISKKATNTQLLIDFFIKHEEASRKNDIELRNAVKKCFKRVLGKKRIHQVFLYKFKDVGMMEFRQFSKAIFSRTCRILAHCRNTIFYSKNNPTFGRAVNSKKKSSERR